MSNAIRYDPLLVRHLAAELAERFGGAPVRAVRLDPDERVASLELADVALVWDLHPTRGWLRIAPPPPAPEAAPLHHRASVGRIEVPPDERILFLDIDSPGRSTRQARRIVVELMTNQWNALVLNHEDRILAALRPRTAGDRVLRPDRTYAAPAPQDRVRDPGREEWRALLRDVPPAERPHRLVRAVACTSPMNARPILGAAADADTAAADTASPDTASTDAARADTDEPLDRAYDRYRTLVSADVRDPHLLHPADAPQPYPLPLPGVPAEPRPSLLDAMRDAAGTPETEAVPRPAVAPELLERLRDRVRRAARRRDRLRDEVHGAAPEAAELRRKADLLLSQLDRVRKGMEEAELEDYAAPGQTVVVELEPALSPVENADRLYDAAQKRERAAERLPALIRRVEREHDSLSALLERAERGEADDEQVEAAVGPVEQESGGREPEALRPYRRYRTSGGLEVRVGRNSRANDELTFHHSSPEDVWLHARHVPGSHVILRWGDRDGNPPRRDLLEAAVLAALNSKARTSGTVAVDWTRRKYVRKPRKAPPGAVIPFRSVSTLFVEPNPAVAKRMAEPL